MSNFMGPMAPPQAAPSQPPQLDIRTNPNQRERFREFMRQNTRPNLAAPAMQQPMMPQAPMPMAPQAPRPPIPMAIRPNAPMMPPRPAPMPYGGNIDVFSPQYMSQSRPMYLEDGGSVPPRRTEIRGQDHMLSYITPEEAGILKALGGSGEPGPMGVPSFPEPGMGGASDSRSGSGNESGSGNGNGNDGGYDADTGIDAETDDPDTAGAGSREAGYSEGPDGVAGTADDVMGTPGSGLAGYEGSSGIAAARERAEAEKRAAEQKAARDLVSRTFATSNNRQSLVGAPNSKTGYVTTGKPNQDQINDALAAAKSLGMDISGSQTATDLGLNDTETTAVEAVGSPTAKTSIESFADLTDLLSAYQTTETPAELAAKAKASETAQLTGLFGASSQTPSTGLTPGFTTSDAELMGMSDIDALADSVLGSSFADSPAGSRQANTETSISNLGVSDDLLGLSSSQFTSPTSTNPAQQAVNDMVTAAANASTRSFAPAASVPGAVATGTSSTPATDFFADTYSDLVESYTGKPDTARGTTATGLMDIVSDLSMIGIASNLLGLDNQFTQPRASAKDRAAFNIGELLSLDERAYDINDAVESGMFNPETGHVTGIQPPGLTKGYLSTNPFGAVVYTGMPDPNYTGPYANLVNPRDPNMGGDGPDPVYIPPVVQPPTVSDPRPEDNMLGGMDVTLGNIDVTGVPSTRVPYEGELRLPVGYGDPRTGYISPEAYRTAGFMPPRGPVPIGFFEDGGAVLDQAAGRFLEALTAA